MNIIVGNKYQVNVKIKTPVGWMNAEGNVTCTAEETLNGDFRLAGISAKICDGWTDGTDVKITAHPKLPFGVLDVTIDAKIEEDGKLTGVGNAPHHKPMEIKGKIEEVA